MTGKIYLRPPKEFTEPGVIWKLRKCVYGLSDASRTWYFRVKEELVSLGVTVSKLVDGLFHWHVEGKLHGVMSVHVDDFCWGGSALFKDCVIKPLYSIFQIGSDYCNTFLYLGWSIQQKEDEITVDQIPYAKSLVPFQYANQRQRSKSDAMLHQTLRNQG